jgi:hypothetical protein
LHFRQCISEYVPSCFSHVRVNSRHLPASTVCPLKLSRKNCVDQRRRFRIRARHPASSPPPRIVMANVTSALVPPVGRGAKNKSCTPPCTISTDKVVSAPMLNHQTNVLTPTLHPLVSAENQRLCQSSRGCSNCQECRRARDHRYDAVCCRGGGGTVRKPRCKKMEMLPAPLFAVTRPGSSDSFAVKWSVDRAKGPPRVR